LEKKGETRGEIHHLTFFPPPPRLAGRGFIFSDGGSGLKKQKQNVRGDDAGNALASFQKEY